MHASVICGRVDARTAQRGEVAGGTEKCDAGAADWDGDVIAHSARGVTRVRLAGADEDTLLGEIVVYVGVAREAELGGSEAVRGGAAARVRDHIRSRSEEHT